MIHKIISGTAVGLLIVVIPVLAQSDRPPFAGVSRVLSIEDQQTEDEIGNVWFQDYCVAERMKNIPAEQAAEKLINTLESRLSSPHSVALLPCP